MPRTTFKQLLDAGVHFGHLKRKWNPKMAPYIFMERNGIHVIDLNKTIVMLDQAAAAMKQIAASGKKILFVATKKQAKDIVEEKVQKINMPYVTERWPGGMLTNFPTIRKTIKKMESIDKMNTDGTFATLSKKEKLQITRQRSKLEKFFGSIAQMNRLPAALFIIDTIKEHIAIKEAKKLDIPIFAVLDTNADPGLIDFPVPANDDASKAISLIMDVVTNAIEEGLNDRKAQKEKQAAEGQKEEKKSGEKPTKSKARKPEKAEDSKENTTEKKAEVKEKKEEKTEEKKKDSSEETKKATDNSEKKTTAKDKETKEKDNSKETKSNTTKSEK